jgi:hypothetical protein
VTVYLIPKQHRVTVTGYGGVGVTVTVYLIPKQHRYVYGPGADTPLVWYAGAGTSDRRWLIPDERGSIVAVTNASGAVTNVNRYDEYGIPAATNVGRFQYTGQAWLPELGVIGVTVTVYLIPKQHRYVYELL